MSLSKGSRISFFFLVHNELHTFTTQCSKSTVHMRLQVSLRARHLQHNVVSRQFTRGYRSLYGLGTHGVFCFQVIRNIRRYRVCKSRKKKVTLGKEIFITIISFKLVSIKKNKKTCNTCITDQLTN